MRRFLKLSVVFIFTLGLCSSVTGCGESDSESDSVTSIKLTYNGSAIANNALAVSKLDSPLTFAADVQVTGKASKDFTLESSNAAVATASGKTLTLVSVGQSLITATATGDLSKKHAITLRVEDSTPYSITVTGGSADKTTAIAGQTITLTAGTQTGKEFSDWAFDPPTVAMISANQFTMPSSDVTVTGNFEDASAGLAPVFITNNFSQDSSSGFIVQWHNMDVNVSTQTLQIVAAAGSFENADEITVTGEHFESSGQTGNFAARNIFKEEVTGLNPATLYKYRMGGTGAWSKTFYHLTSGGQNTNFSFTVVADPQSDAHSAMGVTLQAANDFDNDNRFFLMCGDIVNQIGDRPAEIASYTNAANEFNIMRPIAATQGNHDTYYTGGGDTYIFGSAKIFNAFVTFPDNGWDQSPYNGNDRSKSYYFYYNNVLVIMLNTMSTGNATGTASPDHTKQAAWLKEILEADRIHGLSKYKIVATHVSPFGGRSAERWLQPEVRAAYGKICADYGVDIFFSGHDHVYGRTNPIKITGESTSNTRLQDIDFNPTPGGTIYSIAGATGPKFYTFENDTSAQYFPVRFDQNNLTPGVFVNVKVTAEKLSVTVVRVGATAPLDTYEVEAKR